MFRTYTSLIEEYLSLGLTTLNLVLVSLTIPIPPPLYFWQSPEKRPTSSTCGILAIDPLIFKILSIPPTQPLRQWTIWILLAISALRRSNPAKNHPLWLWAKSPWLWKKELGVVVVVVVVVAVAVVVVAVVAVGVVVDDDEDYHDHYDHYDVSLCRVSPEKKGLNVQWLIPTPKWTKMKPRASCDLSWLFPIIEHDPWIIKVHRAARMWTKYHRAFDLLIHCWYKCNEDVPCVNIHHKKITHAYILGLTQYSRKWKQGSVDAFLKLIRDAWILPTWLTVVLLCYMSNRVTACSFPWEDIQRKLANQAIHNLTTNQNNYGNHTLCIPTLALSSKWQGNRFWKLL